MDTQPTTAEQRGNFHGLLTRSSVAMLVTRAAEGRLRARPMALAQVEADCRALFVPGA